MCRGIALGYNKDKEPHVICEGISSHTKTLGREEDDYLKFEIIIDESKESNYSIELDNSYFFNGALDDKVIKIFNDYFNKNLTLKQSVLKAVEAWVRKNEVFVLRNLLINSHYGRFKEQDMSYCQSKGKQDMSYCKAWGDQYMFGCKAKGNQDMSECEAEGNQHMSVCKAKKEQHMSRCEAGEDQYMSDCEAGGDQYMSYCKAKDNQNMFGCVAGYNQDMSCCRAGKDQLFNKCHSGGDQYMSGCEAEGIQYMSYCKAGEQFLNNCKAKGNQDMSGCEAGGNQYIAHMKSSDQEANEFLKKLSGLNNKITMAMLIRMAMKCPEDVVSTILKGGKPCAEE